MGTNSLATLVVGITGTAGMSVVEFDITGKNGVGFSVVFQGSWAKSWTELDLLSSL